MERSSQADIAMRIINPDGSEAEMCGNGARCAAHWAHHAAGLAKELRLETGAGILQAQVSGDTVRIQLTDPRGPDETRAVQVPEQVGGAYWMDTGVPHVVTEIRNIATLNVQEYGAKIRYHDNYKPRGANASFFQKKAAGEIICRVYERGVEGETQSCGTGSTASALVAAMKYQWSSPVKVHVASGDVLNIYFDKENRRFSNVCLEGAVKRQREGVFQS
jgi:diaminopimelate epimerase